MGSFADYLEKKFLDEAFGGTDFTPPATVYVGLSTTTIADDGTSITEPSGNAYARVALTNNSTNWPNATGSGVGGSSKANGTNITFPQATGDWGNLTDFFIADASTAGNILAYGVLTIPKHPTNGDTASFAIGQLVITLD